MNVAVEYSCRFLEGFDSVISGFVCPVYYLQQEENHDQFEEYQLDDGTGWISSSSEGPIAVHCNFCDQIITFVEIV